MYWHDELSGPVSRASLSVTKTFLTALWHDGQMASNSPVAFGRFEWRPAQRQLLADGVPTALKARALDVLQVLMTHRDRVVSKGELLDLVWGNTVVEEANLHVQISGLRKVLGPAAIATIPGHGYRFTAPLAGDEALVSAAAAFGVPADASPGSVLPPQPLLIGRSDDLCALVALLAGERLVTLVGPGGIGKTRLALAAAAHNAALRDAWPDGVWWVDAAAVHDPLQLVPAVAQALHVPLPAGRGLAGLVEALHGSRLLLVMDNCEHLIGAAAALADALLAAPAVRLLVTSQELLNLPGERLLRLQPLGLPPPGEAADERFGAVQLFVERARAVDRGFELDPSNAAAVADICRQLDGLPLAIELAAARVRQLGLQALRERLGDSLRLLSGGTRTALPRHRTLRAALEWSHALLAPAEQLVLRRLGVFVGGFTLELAQQVAADQALPAGHGALDDWAVLDALGGLVDRSLVALQAGEAARYRLLQTMRLFALEQLAQHGELERQRERHARAIAAFYASHDDARWGDGEQSVGGDTMPAAIAELENARAALHWARTADDRGLTIQLAAFTAAVFHQVGAAGEVVPTLLALRPHLDDAPPAAQVALLLRLGSLGRTVGISTDELLRVKQDAVGRARAAGMRRRLHSALAALGWSLASDGDPPAARAALAEALALEQLHDPPTLRVPRLGLELKLAELSGDLEATTLAAYAVHAAFEQIEGVAAARAASASNLRYFLSAAGRFDESAALARRTLAHAGRRQLGLHEILSAVMPLAATGCADEAVAALRTHRHSLHNHPPSVWMRHGIEGLAMLAVARGRADDALQILAEQQRRGDVDGKPFDLFTRQLREHVLARCRAAGHDEPMPAAWRTAAPLRDDWGLLLLGLGAEIEAVAAH